MTKNREASTKAKIGELETCRKPLWQSKGDYSSNDHSSKPRDTLFAGQGRFARDPRSIREEKVNQMTKDVETLNDLNANVSVARSVSASSRMIKFPFPKSRGLE